MTGSWLNWAMGFAIVFAFGLAILEFSEFRVERTALSDRCRQGGGVLLADANRKPVCVKAEVLK